MSQGWVVDSVANTITFNEPPANAVAIVVTETATGDINATDIWAKGAWGPGPGYPSEVEFYSDRLVWANTDAQPQTLWMSKTGAYNQFGKSVPLIDEDSITVTINARRVNSIQELVPLADLIIMTTSGEWKLTAGADEIVAPGKVGFKPQSYFGTEGIPAQVVGDTAIFVQARGNIIRDMSYQIAADGYRGNDLTIYAAHLLEGYRVVDICFQQAPYSAVWIVRDDGMLISLTYIREQEVVGWALHRTDGTFESVCTVPEGDADAVYVTVRRNINGTERVNVERLAPRSLEDVRDAFFVDSGLTYDGRLPGGTITLSGGGDWDENEELTATCSTAHWVGASDVGDVIRLFIDTPTLVDGNWVDVRSTVRLRIQAYVSATVVTVRPLIPIPAPFRLTAFTNWEILRDSISGLDHLAGETVAILADGLVVEPQVVVYSGGAWKITLDTPAAVVHVGLPYQSLLESLDINIPGSETVRDKPKLISKVGLLVRQTRGLLAGPNTGDLYEFKQREDEDWGDPVALRDGLMEVLTESNWDKNGRFVVVQDDPLPCTILALIPDVTVGGVGQ